MHVLCVAQFVTTQMSEQPAGRKEAAEEGAVVEEEIQLTRAMPAYASRRVLANYYDYILHECITICQISFLLCIVFQFRPILILEEIGINVQ